MIYSLYVKEHNITHKKYLGQTKQNPEIYSGSGKDWHKELSKYGRNHWTYVIATSENKEDINKLGREYSQIWNIVESNDWLNKIPETGGGEGLPKGYKFGPYSEERKATLRGVRGPQISIRTIEHNKKLGIASGKARLGKKRGPCKKWSIEAKERHSLRIRKVWEKKKSS